jgi:ribonuclease HI
MLACGWSKMALMQLNSLLQKSELRVFEFIAPWAVNVEDSLLIYRSYNPIEIQAAFESVTGGEIIAYCDGSGTTGDKPAGIGCYINRVVDKPLLFAENIGPGTNNRAELCAIWRALRTFPDVSQRLLIRTDSEYAIGSLTKDWARNKNEELITNIRLDLGHRRSNVHFEHVDGHSGVEGNEIADSLAKIGRKLVTTVSIYEG